jgi:hypothetical protein
MVLMASLARWFLCISWVLSCGWILAGEGAVPEAKSEAAAPKAADGSEAAKAAAPATPAPAGAFPLQSEFFQYVLDNQAEDQQEAQQIELNAMKDILAALKGVSEEQLTAAVNPKATFRELMLRPEQYRGHVVRIRGLLKFSEVPKHIGEAAGMRLYRGQIANMMGEIVTYISLTPPESTKEMPVRLTGVFMKRYAYLNEQEGDKLTWTPLVFVKRVEPYAEDQEYTKTSPLAYLLIGVVVFVFIAWFAFRVSRYNTSRVVKNNPFTRKKRELEEKKKKG